MLTQTDLKDRLRSALQAPGGASSDFDLNPGYQVPDTQLRDAAVLIAFQNTPSGVNVVLTKRSSALKHHPGQIAFPGGKRDEADADLQATALREAREEISLNTDHIEVLGTLPSHQTVTSFQVTPFLGWIDKPASFQADPGEVSEVFQVPVEHVLNRANYRIEGRYWRGQMRRFYCVPYGPYYIWGATARILRALSEQIAR